MLLYFIFVQATLCRDAFSPVGHNSERTLEAQPAPGAPGGWPTEGRSGLVQGQLLRRPALVRRRILQPPERVTAAGVLLEVNRNLSSPPVTQCSELFPAVPPGKRVGKSGEAGGFLTEAVDRPSRANVHIQEANVE